MTNKTGFILFSTLISLILTGCAATQSSRGYLMQSLKETPVLSHQQLKQQRPADIPDKQYSVSSVRFVTRGSAVKANFSRSTYHESGQATSFPLMDFGVEIDIRGQLPVYRLTLRPINFGQAVVDQWQGLAYVAIQRYQFGEAAKHGQPITTLYAPLPADRGLKNGGIVTDWTYCETCVGKIEPDNPENRGLLLHKYFVEPLRYEFSGRIVRGGISATAKPVLLTGQAALAARDRRVADLKRFNQDTKVASAANLAYEQFWKQQYDPISMATFLKQRGCPMSYSGGASRWGGDEQQRDVIRHNQRYIECRERAVADYDFDTYAARLPDLLAEEEQLWGETHGIERYELPDVQGQFDYATGHFGAAYDAIEYADYRREQMAEQRAANDRKRARSQALMQSMQASVNALQSQVRDSRPVVRNGMVTTVGEERERSRRQPLPAAPKKPRDRQEAPVSKEVAVVSAEPTEEPTENKAVARADSQTSNQAAVTAKDQQKAQAEAERIRQQEQADYERRLAALNKPDRIRGSIYGGCVEVVKTERIPGSSAASSCSYEDPEREALYLTFLNRCSVPVNIEMNVILDNGGATSRGEYNIKTGSKRRTSGICGASRYDFSYEETTESFLSRGG